MLLTGIVQEFYKIFKTSMLDDDNFAQMFENDRQNLLGKAQDLLNEATTLQKDVLWETPCHKHDMALARARVSNA